MTQSTPDRRNDPLENTSIIRVEGNIRDHKPTRVEAAMMHLDQRADGGRCAEMVADMLAAADAVDPLRVPSAHLAGKVPLVLYFATRADADEFAVLVKDAFTNPVEIVV